MLESLNSETPNIKDLSAEIPETYHWNIDVSALIDPEVQQDTFNQLKEYFRSVQGKSAEDLLELAYQFRLIFPEEFQQISIGENAWKIIIKKFEDLKNDSAFKAGYAIYSAKLKVTFPDLSNSLELPTRMDNDLLTWFTQWKPPSNKTFVCSQALKVFKVLKILFPMEVDEKYFTDKEWDKIDDFFLTDKKRLLHDGLALRLASNSRCNNILSHLTNSDIEELKEAVKKSNRYIIANEAINLKALVAKSVVVDSRGLNFLDEDIETPEKVIPPFPDQRSF